MQFKNPQNGHVQTITAAPMWCLLFGSLYFLRHRAIFHAVLSLLAAGCTFFLSWLIYPFFAPGIVRSAYLERGWQEVNPPAAAVPPVQRWQKPYSLLKRVTIALWAVIILAVVLTKLPGENPPTASSADASILYQMAN